MRAAAVGWWLMAGCGPPAAPEEASTMTQGVVVRWAVSQGLWGEEDLTVFADGSAHYRFERATGGARSRETSVSPAELAAIERGLIEHDFCGLASARLGIPDEGRPTLSVRLGAVRCSVTLWDGEWRDEERAAAVMAILGPLFARVGASPP